MSHQDSICGMNKIGHTVNSNLNLVAVLIVPPGHDGGAEVMDKNQLKEFMNAIGAVAETTLIFYRSIIKEWTCRKGL